MALSGHLQHTAQADTDAEDMNSNVVLQGSLSFIELGELLQQLGSSGSTGTIKLVSGRVDEPGYIYLNDGNPVHAECGTQKGIDALYGFFGWTSADFEFLREDVNCEPTIKQSRMEIILDGLRMFDDGLIPEIGPATGEKSGETHGETHGEADETSKKKSKKDKKTDLPVIKGSVVDYVYVVDEEEFPAGTDVVAQDRFGNWFWVILSGQMEVIRILPEGEAPIVRLTDGAYIGSIVSFLREGNVRSATVKAIGKVQLGVLDSELISREYAAMSDDLQNLLISLDKRLRQVSDVCARSVLRQNILTSGHKKMKKLISRDRNENEFLRITAGQAWVVRKIPGGNVHLCTLSEGDFAGAIPFLNSSHEPYSASVYASKDFRAERFDLQKVNSEYDTISNTFKNMVQYMSTSISVTTGRILDITGKQGS